MKKLFTIFALMMITTSVMAATTPSTKVGSFLDKVSAKENEVTSKIEANQKAREAKKQEFQAKQEADKKAIEAKKQALQAKQDANKKTIQKEVDFWKNIGK